MQRWKPTTRSARHKLNKFIKEHEQLLRPEPESLAGAAPALPAATFINTPAEDLSRLCVLNHPGQEVVETSSRHNSTE